LRIVYEIFFSNAPKPLCFTREPLSTRPRDFLMAGIIS
jgi:hypothetical protein